MAWLYQLDRTQQAALLANPHGYLPVSVVDRITGHVDLVRRDETPHPQRWQLRSADANLLEDERLRLDDWWSALPAHARSDILATRHTEVPEQYRETVLDLVSGGISAETDLGASFRASGIAAAYLEMVYRKEQTARGGHRASNVHPA